MEKTICHYHGCLLARLIMKIVPHRIRRLRREWYIIKDYFGFGGRSRRYSGCRGRIWGWRYAWLRIYINRNWSLLHQRVTLGIIDDKNFAFLRAPSNEQKKKC